MRIVGIKEGCIPIFNKIVGCLWGIKKGRMMLLKGRIMGSPVMRGYKGRKEGSSWSNGIVAVFGL